MKNTIKVSGMHCKSCEILLTDSISEINGVEKVQVDSKKQLVDVELNDEKTLELVKKVIEKEGYKVIG